VSGATAGGTGATRPATWSDPLYGSIRVSGWATSLLETAPFRRLAGISLSDVPGELLFGHPFPSRLDHVRGVYHLARLARPRDRTLQAAALAHDLGHGPFSHLTEPLMRAWLGCDHEERSARRLADVRAALPASALRRLAWLDWDEVATLVVGAGTDGRGALLNGRLDYDNLDNVARFLLAPTLSVPGSPGYVPETLARALRPLPPDAAAAAAAAGDTVPEGERVEARPREPAYLLAQAQEEALAWQVARARLYGYLHSDHANLAPHAMLRKAIDLARVSRTLPADFLDLTDAPALACLAENSQRGTAALALRVQAGRERWHSCVWEAEVPAAATATRTALGEWRMRLGLEAELASEAGLAAHEVILEVLTSRAGRALPPLASAGRPGALTWLPAPLPAPRLLHVFVGPDTPRDYRRRLRAAAERRLGGLGVVAWSSGRARGGSG
jgi:HD superfamily phosphohydrolase